jgi:hypothetical protein
MAVMEQYCVKLTLVKAGKGVNVFTAENGDVYLLRPVTREYTNNRKRPIYYISRKRRGEKHAKYLSGLFATEKPTRFSFDIKDRFNIKHMYWLDLSPDGQKARISRQA